MSGKPIDEAVELLHELRAPYVCMADSHEGEASGDDFKRIVRGLDAAIVALTAAQQQGQAVACGGCGNADPEKVCVGCLHPFAAPQPMQQGGGEVEPTACKNIPDWAIARSYRKHVDALNPQFRAPSALIFASDVTVEAHRMASTAPPSAPVGVDLDKVAAHLAEHGGDFDALILLVQEAALSQQPAAVDEAMVNRASLAYEAEVDGDTHSPNVPREAMRAALTAALATQHQEPTT